MIKKNLTKNFFKKKITIGVVGLGYVGLPLAILFAKKGFKVFGFDTDVVKIKILNSKKSYIERIAVSDITLLLKKGEVSSVFQNIKQVTPLSLCHQNVIALVDRLPRDHENFTGLQRQ